ncbi:hypothetical protein SFRURICE_012269 [Spodoptera frugiperda]|uniref:SFRICE_022183 n=1 Tax=Spodoptera frugiperda TaxID=7108 RepID=A0A2H1VAU1_SPOFR|nr:hypothetical protein SFRURICE_012269 [Spodoptera frugiperda]
MFKLLVFACLLAVAVAAPKPAIYYTSPYTAYAAPVGYSAYSTQLAYAPLTYSAYAPVSYSAYSVGVSSPYTAIYYT